MTQTGKKNQLVLLAVAAQLRVGKVCFPCCAEFVWTGAAHYIHGIPKPRYHK